MRPPLIVFDDDLGELGPMTDLRASFEVRTGMLTTAARLAAQRPEKLAGYRVPPRLADVVAERSDVPVNRLPEAQTIFCANGRWRDPDPKLSLADGEAAVEEGTGHVVAARLPRADAEAFLDTGRLPEATRRRPWPAGALYRYPWDVLAALAGTLRRDTETVRLVDALVPQELVNVVGTHAVEVHRTAKLYPNVVLDAGGGPIIVWDHAVIRPGAVLCGPCSIGRGSTVVDHALVKADTVIGPVCKVGGEVGGTIFQGYANKAHDGHLGDSWVGQWVNFGAGTTNSNLLNTYGEVTLRLEPEGSLHRTGLTFHGAVIGDHVKLAIDTRLMTGAVIGTGAMIATTAAPPPAVRRFAWLTDRGESVFRLSKFLETMNRMMARRDKVPGDAYVEAVRGLHARAVAGRRGKEKGGEGG